MGSCYSSIQRKYRAHWLGDTAARFFKRIMSLPLEIREKIYESMFIGIYNRMCKEVGDKPFYRILPPVPFCFANRQIYNESVPVMLRCGHIVLDSSTPERLPRLWKALLDTVPDQQAYRSVTYLNLGILKTPKHAAILNQMIEHCSGLRTLRILIDECALVSQIDQSSYPAQWSAMPKAKILQTFDFTKVLELPNLQKLILYCHGLSRNIEEEYVNDFPFQDLVDDVADKIANRRLRVKLHSIKSPRFRRPTPCLAWESD